MIITFFNGAHLPGIHRQNVTWPFPPHRNIADLTCIYGEAFPSFADNEASIIRRVEWCIGQLENVIEQHSKSIMALSIAALEITELTKDYKDKADSFSNGATHAGIASANLSIAGITVGTLLAPIATPLATLGAFVFLTAGGRISQVISMVDRQ